MNEITERIARLRSLMETYHMDAYLVPTADFHESEYVGEHFACRKYITGFTGSAGIALITKDWAGLWIRWPLFRAGGRRTERQRRGADENGPARVCRP